MHRFEWRRGSIFFNYFWTCHSLSFYWFNYELVWGAFSTAVTKNTTPSNFEKAEAIASHGNENKEKPEEARRKSVRDWILSIIE